MRLLVAVVFAAVAFGQALPLGGIPSAVVVSTYTVTGAAVPHGTTTCTSPVNAGLTTTCTLAPDSGWSSLSATSTCGGSLASNTFTTGAVNANCTVTAVFSVSDNFNRANENPLSNGGKWAAVTGEGNMQIVTTNKVGGVADAAWQTMRWTGTTFGANQCSQAKTLTQFHLMWVAVRVSASADTYYYMRGGASTAWSVWKIVNGGTRTKIGTDYAAAVTNDVVKLCVSGTTLTPYINGVAQATQTDSAIATGQPGFGLLDTTSYADDWVGYEQ